MPPPIFSLIAYPSLGIHRGAIDPTMITTKSPPEVMQRIRTALDQMGIAIEVESEWRYRCVRPGRTDDDLSKLQTPEDGTGCANASETNPQHLESANHTVMVNDAVINDTLPTSDLDGPHSHVKAPPAPFPPLNPPHNTYGPRAEDPGGEVRFSVELTRLDRLEAYSLDIRRLKGSLRSYKFIYDSLRTNTDVQT